MKKRRRKNKNPQRRDSKFQPCWEMQCLTFEVPGNKLRFATANGSPSPVNKTGLVVQNTSVNADFCLGEQPGRGVVSAKFGTLGMKVHFPQSSV